MECGTWLTKFIIIESNCSVNLPISANVRVELGDSPILLHNSAMCGIDCAGAGPSVFGEALSPCSTCVGVAIFQLARVIWLYSYACSRNAKYIYVLGLLTELA